MFDWTNYSNLTRLQINVDAFLFSNRKFDSFFDTTRTVIGVTRHMHNSLAHRSHNPSNPQEEFLLKNTQVNLETFSHFIRVVSLLFYTTQHNITQHNFTENRKKEKKPSDALSLI